MATTAPPLVEGAGATFVDCTMAVSKHLPSIYHSSIGIFSLNLSFLRNLRIIPTILSSLVLSLSLRNLDHSCHHNHNYTAAAITKKTTTVILLSIQMGISDHCLALSGWAMTIVSLVLTLLGPIWYSILFWLFNRIKALMGYIV